MYILFLLFSVLVGVKINILLLFLSGKGGGVDFLVSNMFCINVSNTPISQLRGIVHSCQNSCTGISAICVSAKQHTIYALTSYFFSYSKASYNFLTETANLKIKLTIYLPNSQIYDVFSCMNFTPLA